MIPSFLVGLGVNPEISVRYNPGSEQKLPAEVSLGIAGTSVNVATNLKELECQVELIGTVGMNNGINCPFHDFLHQSLVRKGISHTLLPVREKTSVAVVTLPTGSPVQIFSDKPAYLSKPFGEVEAAVRGFKPNYVVVTGVTLDEVDLVKTMLAAGQDIGATTVLNPRRALIVETGCFRQILSHAKILVVNEEEFCGFTGNGHATFADMREISELGPEIVLVTRDARGAMLYTAGGIQINQPAIDVGTKIDEVGAGDCFLAHFLYCLSQGQDYGLAMKLASLAAGIKVTKIGGSNIPTRQETANHRHLVDMG